MAVTLSFDSGAGDFSFPFWIGSIQLKSIQLERTQRPGASQPQYQPIGYSSPIFTCTVIALHTDWSSQQSEITGLLALKGKNFTFTDFRGNQYSNLKLVDIVYNDADAGDMNISATDYDYCTQFTLTIEHIGA